MENGNLADANNLIHFRYTGAAGEDPMRVEDTFYSPNINNNTYRYSNLTGMFNVADMADDDQITQYFNLDDPAMMGPYRTYKYKYGLYDSEGKLKRELDWDRDLKNNKIVGGRPATHFYGGKKVDGVSPKSPYAGHSYQDITDESGEFSGYRIYYSTKDSKTAIIELPGRDYNVRLPKEAAQVLANNKKWPAMVLEFAQNNKDFAKAISGEMKSRNSVYVKSIFMKCGFTPQEAQILFDAIYKVKGKYSKAYEAKSKDMRVKKPHTVQSEKNGGRLDHLPTLQFGGVAGGSKQSLGVSERRQEVKGTDPRNAAGIGEIGGKN